MTKQCLAKFDPDEFLECHITSALNVLKSMKNAFSWFSDDIWKLAFYSIILHDLGKCARGFQENPRTWGYRHEVLSVPFTKYLDLGENEKNIVTASVYTHHRYINDESFIQVIKNNVYGYERYTKKLDELLECSEYLENYIFPRISYWESNVFGSEINIFNLPDDWKEDLKSFDFEGILNWIDFHRSKDTIPIFVKGLLNACDHLASAGENSVLTLPDIKDIMDYHIKKLRELQKKALETKGNVLLRAPTGYGKTETSLLWAYKNMDALNLKRNVIYPNRIFYILPYKATINAMYERLRDYFKSTELVGIVHSSSNYYLYSSSLDYKRLSSAYRKIYSPLKVTTPFQLMKSLFGVGFFEMGLTEIKNSLLIFDEIHAYDDNVLGIILAMIDKFVNEYDSKVLVMSATLPTFLEELFEDIINPTKLQLKEENPDDFTRHRINIIDGDVYGIVDILENEKGRYTYKKEKSFSFEKPLLIVCNTVDTATEIYRKMKEKGGKGLLLHSRFTYEDREKYEQSLKTGLDSYDFVVSTQVVEVSLDISFNSIISEYAPIDALIQRFGRVNRSGWKEKKIKDVFVLSKKSGNDYVYEDSKLGKYVKEKSIEELSKLDGEILKESEIKDLVDSVYSGVAEEKKKEMKKYQERTLSIFDSLYPFKKGIEEETFYKLFSGKEIIPVIFKPSVEDLIKKRRSIEIYRYIVPINQKKFEKIKRNMLEAFETRNKRPFLTYANLKYDSEKGLLEVMNDDFSNII